MNLKDIHSVYFLGIGGIGMSALARYFKFIGKEVAGYDKTETPLTRELAASGIEIHYEDNVDLIPKKHKDLDTTLVVFTPALPKNHLELNYYLTAGLVLKKDLKF